MQYFLRNGSLFNYANINITNVKGKSPLFENNYIVWSQKKRLVVKQGRIVGDSLEKVKRDGFGNSSFNLVTQIYLDMNPTEDGFYIFTVSIFDVYKSYCEVETSPLINCFINIYFDICEIGRLELDKNLKGLKTKNEVDLVYKAAMKEINRKLENYLDDVNMGKDYKNLVKWNSYVTDNLRINNMEIFEITK